MDASKHLQTMAPYDVQAFNIAAELENKIHHDSVARRYGFSGGLVPGSAVFGYMAHQPVALWGVDWLKHGSATCRFSHPVYDGQSVQVTALRQGARMDLEVNSKTHQCATGYASIHSGEAAPDLNARLTTLPPSLENRPTADTQSLAPGTVLCTKPHLLTRTQALQWLDDLRETDPVYANAGLLHPATLLRLCNWSLMQNVALGPWIHTQSHIRNFHAMPVGASLVARAVVLRNWVHKGHCMVELDVVVVIDEKLPAARITHTLIYLPRQVSSDEQQSK